MTEILGAIRRPKKIKKKLEELAKMTDLRSALELMVGLQGEVRTEIRTVAKYDESTGKPVAYAWRPYNKFGTRFTYERQSMVELTPAIITALKEGPVCFDVNGATYVAKYEVGYADWMEDSVYLSKVRSL
jgi:hypothetical protein